MKKLIFALIVVAAVLVVAMPVAAQGPNPYIPVSMWYNRTPQMNATWAGDPFGGWPKLPTDVKYVPDGKGGVAAQFGGEPPATWVVSGVPPATVSGVGQTGIVAKFGLSPWANQTALPGGIPSSMSGDGSTVRKAIYIGGAWADPSVDPRNGYFGAFMGSTNLPQRGSNENPYELPACATVKIPAATSKWFKLDTWKNEPAGTVSQANTPNTVAKVTTQIWLDDELDGATAPSGKAAFGAADHYMYGTAPDDAWSMNDYWGANPQTREEINGYFMGVYGPGALAPNYAFAAPNAWLLTANVSPGGGPSRGCTAAAYAGQPCVSAGSGGNSQASGISQSKVNQNWTTGFNFGGPGWAVNGFSVEGTYNPSQPSHLLFVSGTWDGWMYVRVYNQMIWDGTVSVCDYRNYTGQ